MLSLRHRGLKASDVTDIMNSGITRAGSSLRVFVQPIASGPLRVAVVCSKKTLKLAVQRNKAKRLVYAALREILPDLEFPCRMVVLLKPGIHELHFQKLCSTLTVLLKHCGLQVREARS